jgi:hypothetical protein
VKRLVPSRVVQAQLAAAGLVFAGCCGPQINQFRAAPVHVQRGGTVTLRWSAEGDATLSSSPRSSAEGPVPSEGTRVVSLSDNTTFRVDVEKCGKTTYREQTVQVEDVTPSCCTPDVASMQCEPGGVLATLTLSEARWGALRIGRVTARALTVTIEHAGVTQALAPNQATQAFAGKPYAGLWRFHYQLPPSVVCPSSAVTSLDLGIDVRAQSGN